MSSRRSPGRPIVGAVYEYRPFFDFMDWALDIQLQEHSWNEFLTLLEVERADVDPEVLDRALGVMMRAAALETGAIENLYQVPRGVTISVAEQGIEWQANLKSLGEGVADHFTDQLEALEYTLDVATRRKPITEVWIRDLHAVVCRHQSTQRVRSQLGEQGVPFAHGRYKTSPNNVVVRDGSTHQYAPVDDVPPQMQRLVSALRSDVFHDAHPVLQCAYAHHALTNIHPFADGNGRVARALGSVYLLRAAGIPLVIFSDQRTSYFDALEAADGGQAQAFVTFVEDRALDTLGMVRDRLQEARSPIDAHALRLRKLLTSHGGLTHGEILAAAKRLASALQPALVREVDRLKADGSLPDEIHSVIEEMPSQQCSYWDRDYRTIPTWPTGVKLKLWIQEPVHVQVETTPMVGVANNQEERFTFIAVDANRSAVQPLLLRLADVHPALTLSGTEKFDAFVRRAVSAALRELGVALAQRLRAEGLRGPTPH
jgi:Fic family protein